MATDFKKAKMNMVLSQIKPNDVYESNVLRAFETVPRENFVPDTRQSLAYIDEDLKIGEGRYLIEPSVFARMVQHAQLTKDSYVLAIGAGYGYGAAILSYLCKTVIALESDPALYKKAKERLAPDFYDNTFIVQSVLKTGYQKESPYDVIFIEGSCAEPPRAVFEQLKTDGGKLYYIDRPVGGRCGQAMCIERRGDHFGKIPLFDANTPYLPGFEPQDAFQF